MDCDSLGFPAGVLSSWDVICIGAVLGRAGPAAVSPEKSNGQTPDAGSR